MLPATTIIIPSYSEADNLSALIPSLTTLMNQFEMLTILVVDDSSPDQTAQILKSFKKKYPFFDYIIRQGMADLSLSVLDGLHVCKTDVILVMDADFSHSPDSVTMLVDRLQKTHADFVLGSRFVSGGGIEERWSVFRRCNARFARWLAKKLVNAHDPLSGFFCFRREILVRAKSLRPIGYKIGLELMVKCRCKKIEEVPIFFNDRKLGKSKLNFKQQIRYLRHLSRLYYYQWREE